MRRLSPFLNIQRAGGATHTTEANVQDSEEPERLDEVIESTGSTFFFYCVGLARTLSVGSGQRCDTTNQAPSTSCGSGPGCDRWRRWLPELGRDTRRFVRMICGTDERAEGWMGRTALHSLRELCYRTKEDVPEHSIVLAHIRTRSVSGSSYGSCTRMEPNSKHVSMPSQPETSKRKINRHADRYGFPSHR